MNPKNKCPQCCKEPALIDKVYGILPGKNCQESNAKVSRPKMGVEFTSDNVRSERKEYGKSILQPYIGGKLSKEYIEEYGTSALANVSKRDIREAQYVYKDELNSHNLHKSKGGKI